MWIKLSTHIIGLLIISQLQLVAEVSPGSMFGDHMVLQRDMPVPVWGTANPGEKVSVEFADHKETATADHNGKWLVKLPALQASAQGREMTIAGTNKIIFKDVLVGEVWICSGQSNMEFPRSKVKELEALVPEAKTKPIRSYRVPTFVSLTPQDNCKGQWSVEPSTSAVAFGLSYYLHEKIDVPIAVIVTCWGSSWIEGWMPLDMTEQLPHFKKMMEEFAAKDKEKVINLIDAAISSGKDAKAWARGDNVWVRQRPNILYNAMMHPIVPYACRGLAWYQGEANAGRYQEYAQSLPLWVQRLRKEWGREDFHFLAVMLPGYGKADGPPDARTWAQMRDAQLSVLQLPHTGVANTIDLGDVKNIHPADKAPIGERLALLACRDVHGQKIMGQGPTYKSIEIKGAQVVISFTYAQGLKTTDGKAPTGFWLSNAAGEWQEATAVIEGETIILTAAGVDKPAGCCYAYTGKPTVNLVNGDNLPAYPFKSDTATP